jgi:hypothetical protein
MIEQFLRLKGLNNIKNPSPVFTYKLYYPKHCMEFKTVKVPADVNIYDEAAILAYINKHLDSSLKIKNEIIVIDRFLNVHNTAYSLKSPPKKAFHSKGFCSFPDFLEAIKPYKNLVLKNIDGTITLDTKI